MPDLITHTITTIPIAVIIKKRLPFFIVLFGATFPDLISRSLMVLFPNHYLLHWFATAFHTPIVILLSIYLVSLLFVQQERKQIFYALLLGSLFHLFLDMLQKHYVGGYYWFFPFNYQSFEFPLFWPEDLINWVMK